MSTFKNLPTELNQIKLNIIHELESLGPQEYDFQNFLTPWFVLEVFIVLNKALRSKLVDNYRHLDRETQRLAESESYQEIADVYREYK
jgi:hypothetical protein